MTHRARFARIALALSVLSVVWFAIAMFGAMAGLWKPLTGFADMTMSAMRPIAPPDVPLPLLPTVLIAIALVALVATLVKAPRKGWFAALLALAIPLAIFAGLLALRDQAQSVPFIHDVATDTQDPPQFSAAMLAAREEDGAKNKLHPFDVPLDTLEEWQGQDSVKGKTLGQLIETGYPDLDLSTLHVVEPVDEVVEVIEDAMEMRGYRGIVAGSKNGIVEGTDKVFWYGFLDDVVARVRPAAGGKGSVVDFRSASRVGLSDLGVNAKRIADLRQATLDRLTAQTPIGEGPAIMVEEAEDEASDTNGAE